MRPIHELIKAAPRTVETEREAWEGKRATLGELEKQSPDGFQNAPRPRVTFGKR